MLPFLGIGMDNTVKIVQVNEQHAFPSTVPAGNYSGITSIGGNRYAVVSDKASEDGFFIFDIKVDEKTGDIVHVMNLGYRSTGRSNRDMEGVAYFPNKKTVFISGEADNQIMEYDLDGKYTGRRLKIPFCFSQATKNYGLESLTYSSTTHLFWTCNESTLTNDGPQANSVNGVRNKIRIQSFSDDLEPLGQYAYLMDAPKAHKKTHLYCMGVSEITALDNGNLLVLEREFYTPSAKIGAFVMNKIYEVNPSTASTIETDTLRNDGPFLQKHLLYEWQTKFNLTNRNIANYEGMCLGPKLADGSQVLLLISDSQNQYAGVLKDWFKSLVIKY